MKAETVLIVDDEKLIRWSLAQELAKEGYRTLEAETRGEALALLAEHGADLIILDQRLPDGTGIEMLQHIQLQQADLPADVQRTFAGVPVIMLTAVDQASAAVQAMKFGAFDYITKPVNIEELMIVVEKALDATRLKRELAHLLKEQFKQFGSCELIGSSPQIREVMEFVGKVAQSSATTVLITGESGTGKELVARAIHRKSDRSEKAFVPVNCSALPETLIESELFGYEKGAFTDARTQKKGLLELAQGGTLFLDEVGEMSPSLQVKLLRVLEERAFRRVGGTTVITTNERVIAATNQALERQMEAGKFRADLYYRLNVASVHIPPLRERGNDVLLLAQHFLEECNRLFHKRFKGLSKETEEIFLHYHWPGNVRELKNALERAVLLSDDEILLPEHLQAPQFGRPAPTESRQAEKPEGTPEYPSLNELERYAILHALEKAGHNQSAAARILKITRYTLRYRMRKYGLLKHGE